MHNTQPRRIHFINLTNGIEPLVALDLHPVAFIRIQSTVCEQKAWDRLILDLDNNFLLHLALGFDCHVWDCSVHNRPARAIRQGLELVRFLVERIWFDRDYHAPQGQSNYFRTIRLGSPAKNKLRYFRRFLVGDRIRLAAHCWVTKHDGDYEFYAKLLKQWKGKMIGNALAGRPVAGLPRQVNPVEWAKLKLEMQSDEA